MLKNRLVNCARCRIVIKEIESNVGLCDKCDYESRENYRLHQEKIEIINKKMQKQYKLTEKLND
jgi:hypothetical protein